MSGFLSDALVAAKTDVEAKRATGSPYGSAKRKESRDSGAQKKKPKWLSNAGVEKRAKVEAHSSLGLSDFDLARSRKALERKEREYKRMFNKGTDMALTGDAADNLMVDFDRKWAEGHRQDSEEDEQDLSDEDPMIEILDEFGRARRIRQSETLIHEKPIVQNERPIGLIYGPHLQRFNPDIAKKDAIWAEEKASQETHYDPNFDLRQKGTGYINLGRGEDRQQRMGDLKKARMETIKLRKTDDRSDDRVETAVLPAAEGNSDIAEFVHISRRGQVEDEDKVLRDGRLRTGAKFLDGLL